MIAAPMVNYMWLTEKEWQSLVPKNPRKGDDVPLPAFFMRRLGSFQMFDPFLLRRGWGVGFWERHQPQASLTVVEALPGEVRMKLEGSFIREAPDKEEGFEIHFQVLGYLTYDVQKKSFSRFDLAVLGEINNACPRIAQALTALMPPGQKRVIGFFFEMVRGDSPMERVRPLGVEQPEYFK
jgi:hypothetical protein